MSAVNQMLLLFQNFKFLQRYENMFHSTLFIVKFVKFT